LTGEDIFLEAMAGPDRIRLRDLIRSHTGAVDRFVATSSYYAQRMAGYLDVPGEKIAVVMSGVPLEQTAAELPPRPAERPPTVGYFARICPEKGVDRAIEAFALLRQKPGIGNARLRIAGYLGKAHRAWWDQQWQAAEARGLAPHIDFLGEVDLAGKLAFYDSIDVLHVPTAYVESKGLYVLEALGRGVPAVQPAHGSFVELAELTGGVDLFFPGDAAAAATSLHGLLIDEPTRLAAGRAGWNTVKADFTDVAMAQAFLEACSTP
jgi:glycosyltransferase involved in cell wall biosynthesis